MSKIASVEIISNIEKHPNPEVNSLSIATVLGWRVVVKSSDFKLGDKVIFIEPDSVVPAIPEFQFMEKCGYRVRTVKFKGATSNGLLAPISLLDGKGVFKVGDSVAEVLGIKHYEKPIEFIPGDAKGKRPSWIPKTDETLLQSTPATLDLFKGREVVFTLKIDGTSGFFYVKDDVFGCGSRELEVKDSESSIYWRMARKYHLEPKLVKASRDLACDLFVNCEIAGPGIQKNNYGSKEMEMFCFNGRSHGKHWSHDKLFSFCDSICIPKVDVIYRGIFNHTLDELQEIADNLKYPSGKLAEGFVIRPVVEALDEDYGRLSRKIISNKFKLKHNE